MTEAGGRDAPRVGSSGSVDGARGVAEAIRVKRRALEAEEECEIVGGALLRRWQGFLATFEWFLLRSHLTQARRGSRVHIVKERNRS
jgi:hypothetical protein